VWDQGDEVWDGKDGESPYPFGVFPLNLPLGWALDGDEDEDPSLVILDAIEEDFHWEVKLRIQRPKVRGSC
jgi:hypothetical protein